MQRYFGTLKDRFVYLSPADEHHLVNVMRAKVHEKIEIVDQGEVFLCEIVTVNPLLITVLRALEKKVELEDHLVLAFSLLKHGNDEWILEKGTELGVKTFLPFISERTIIRLDEEGRKKKVERFRKIVKGASEQSKRNEIPEVLDIIKFPKVLDYDADLRLFAYENVSKETNTLPEAYKSLKEGGECLILIGPEGGYSESEANMANEKEFTFVSLGKRILRAETAAIYAASTFAYEREGKK
ncbi:MAG: 16S rRNA (uracil(1498)-N(3))-methyltransferase [Bacilli bacterium]|nr:16S rRNA (uracil(1498)-N(3))-methyltransferase [Bacilli bacterium]